MCRTALTVNCVRKKKKKLKVRIKYLNRINKFLYVMQRYYLCRSKKQIYLMSYMNRFIYLLFGVALLSSCAETYNVEGSTSVSALDGSKLYLKALKNKEIKNIKQWQREKVHKSLKIHDFDDIYERVDTIKEQNPTCFSSHTSINLLKNLRFSLSLLQL